MSDIYSKRFIYSKDAWFWFESHITINKINLECLDHKSLVLLLTLWEKKGKTENQ